MLRNYYAQYFYVASTSCYNTMLWKTNAVVDTEL